MDVIIVDDEPSARRKLREFCAREADLRIVGEYGDAKSALDAIRTTPPDLLFLDIQIGKSNGVELARALGSDRPPIVVFVTAHDQYAIEAFSVSAADYLLKPFDKERFSETLARARRRWEVQRAADRQSAIATTLTQLETVTRALADARPRLLAEADGHMRMLDVAAVELIEADGNYVRLRVGRDLFHIRSTLQHLEKSLQADWLLRISRTCLVNVNHVREVGRTPRGDYIFVLAGGSTATSSEGFRSVVRQYLTRFKVEVP